MSVVLLATCPLLPDGEYGGDALVASLKERGVEGRWAAWDDGSVDWAAADLVAVRSTWDYHRRVPDFLAWARSLDQRRLLNGAQVFAWNADKAYLTELDVPAVPTELLDDATLLPGLEAALGRWGTVVVKPRVGASGIGVIVVDDATHERLWGLAPGPWVVQPLVASVREVGETSVFVFDGRAVAQVDKLPVPGEIRVQEQYDGSIRPVPLDPARAEVAEHAVRAAAERHGADLAYARVDLMRWRDAWVLSELELIEPGLYLDAAPAIAGRFADLVASRLVA